MSLWANIENLYRAQRERFNAVGEQVAIYFLVFEVLGLWFMAGCNAGY